jgi:Holliday junction DNA helicase RuvA
MIDYIKGSLEEIGATEITVENNGIGYKILISLQTYETLNGLKEAKVYIHHYLREDEELYYGFASKDERELFRLLIGVSGIGVSTARMMLSSLTSEEIRNAILAEDINKIKSIKGIGLKSAQRLILELKDKVSKGGGTDNTTLFTPASNPAVDEATTALVLLGFTKANVTKADCSTQREAKCSIGGDNQARIETTVNNLNIK